MGCFLSRPNPHPKWRLVSFDLLRRQFPMTDRHSTEGVSRRDFLKTAGAGTALACAAGLAPEDKAVLPQKVLGRTKVQVPILGLGTAPAGFRSEQEAVAFFHQCI